MPQGKGTYGSQVGRPSKKKKYEGGGSIDPFSTKNPDSVVVKQALEEMQEQSDIPTSNAMERNETSPMGAEVGTGVYKEGGKWYSSETNGYIGDTVEEATDYIKKGYLDQEIEFDKM